MIPVIFRKLQWFHWVGLSVAVASGTALVLTGHVSATRLGHWLAGLIRVSP